MITTGPVGRFLVSPQPSAQSSPSTPPGWITTPSSFQNNGGGVIPLAPAMVSQNDDTISVEFVGTFPDNYQPGSSSPPSYTNNKYDFGPVTLVVNGNGTSVTVATVDYTDTNGGNQRGWLFDYDISGNVEAQTAPADPHRGRSIELDAGDARATSRSRGGHCCRHGAGCKHRRRLQGDVTNWARATTRGSTRLRL